MWSAYGKMTIRSNIGKIIPKDNSSQYFNILTHRRREINDLSYLPPPHTHTLEIDSSNGSIPPLHRADGRICSYEQSSVGLTVLMFHNAVFVRQEISACWEKMPLRRGSESQNISHFRKIKAIFLLQLRRVKNKNTRKYHVIIFEQNILVFKQKAS